jgi:hypothetical protein
MPASKPSLSTSRVIFYKHTLPTTKMSPYQLPIGHRSRAWDEHPPSPGHMTTKSASATGPGRGQTWPFSRLTGPLWPLRGSFAPAPRCARPTASESAHPSAREPAGGGPLRGLSSGPRVSAGVFPPQDAARAELRAYAAAMVSWPTGGPAMARRARAVAVVRVVHPGFFSSVLSRPFGFRGERGRETLYSASVSGPPSAASLALHLVLSEGKKSEFVY